MIRVVEPAGKLLLVRLTAVDDSVAEGRIESEVEHRPEPAAHVTLALALLPAAPLEEALERCTELGAAAFVLVRAARSVSRASKRERWATICREAAMVAGRLRVPEVTGPVPFAQAWREAENPYLMEPTAATRLGALTEPADLTLFLGPEGGWSKEELELAGDRRLTLGPRNLRAQTAAAATLAVALAGRGDL